MKLVFFRLRRNAYSRLISAAAVLLGVLLLGATSYYAVGEGRWSWFDCFYMTIITLSTVGFAETDVREAGALVVAVHRADGDYVYNPGSEHLLQEGDSLFVLAESQDVANLRAGMAAGAGT